MAMSQHPVSRLTDTAALAALVVMLACLLLVVGQPFYTDDGWWHLAAGEAFSMHGPWLSEDPLLFTGRDGGPVPHEWLFDLLTWQLHELAGFHGVRVVQAVLVLVALCLAFVMTRACDASRGLAALVVALLVLIATPRFMQMRPDLVSIPFTLLGLFGVALASVVALLVAVRFVWMAVLPVMYVAHWLVVYGRTATTTVRAAAML